MVGGGAGGGGAGSAYRVLGGKHCEEGRGGARRVQRAATKCLEGKRGGAHCCVTGTRCTLGAKGSHVVFTSTTWRAWGVAEGRGESDERKGECAGHKKGTREERDANAM